MNDQTNHVNPDDVVRLTERAALFQEAAAARLRLNVTDLRCLALTAAEPGISASRLAELSGLTTGAITGVLDRLERSGLVRRESDSADRRRTLVRALPDRQAEIDAVYAPLERAIDAVRARLDAHQQDGLSRFLGSAADIFEEQTAWLRAGTHGGMVGAMFSAPLGDAQEGTLTFTSGAPRVSLRAAALGPATEARMVAELAHSTLRIGPGTQPGELCRATFSGPLPDSRARQGSVSMHYRKRLDWRARVAQVELAPSIPWSLTVSGGLSEVVADLSGLRLRSFDLRGGADQVTLVLPVPEGTGRIRMSGSLATLVVRYPAGSGLRLALSGGAQEVRFGEQRLRQVHGQLRLATPSAELAPDRYEMEISGGVRGLTVESV